MDESRQRFLKSSRPLLSIAMLQRQHYNHREIRVMTNNRQRPSDLTLSLASINFYPEGNSYEDVRSDC